MTAAPPDDLLRSCRAAIETLARNAGARLSEVELQTLARELAVRASRRQVTDQQHIEVMARNFLADGPAVRAMLDHEDPAHQEHWEHAHATILRWLHARGLYPADDLTLDDRAPDVAALGDLQRALPEFDHACQLETFIISLTQRRAQRWLRDRAATKRGGEGIFSRARRKQQQQEGVVLTRRRDQVRYLSQLIADEGSSLEELIGSSGLDIAELVEERALLQLVIAEAQALAAEQGNDLIVKIWYAAFIEGHSYRDLARRYGMEVGQIASLFRRFKARLQVALQAWLEQA